MKYSLRLYINFFLIFVLFVITGVIIYFAKPTYDLYRTFKGATNKATNSKPKVIIYLRDDVAQREVNGLKTEILKIKSVSEVVYISKDKALENYKEQNKNKPELIKAIEGQGNPLPPSLEVICDSTNFNNTTTQIYALGNKPNYNNIIIKISSNVESKENLTAISGFTDSYGIRKLGPYILGEVLFLLIIVTLLIFNNKK